MFKSGVKINNEIYVTSQKQDTKLVCIIAKYMYPPTFKVLSLVHLAANLQ